MKGKFSEFTDEEKKLLFWVIRSAQKHPSNYDHIGISNVSLTANDLLRELALTED
jgi:hypothetical protein